MKNTRFIFSVHNHQPFGNFDNVMEDCFKRSYRPLIDTLIQNPFVRTVLHISGPLLIWLKARHPEHIKKIRGLIEKNQLSLLGGTYSEAVLSTLSVEDRLLQLMKYKELIHNTFGEEQKLDGFWLTERVWTQDIVKNLAQAGYKYTFVDDTHIKKAGISKSADLFRTEYLGYSIFLFPISRYLRYNFPFRPADEILKNIKNKNLVIHADDGEKFGDWPGMYDYLFEEKKLSKLFNQLRDENIDFIFPEKLLSETGDIEDIFIPYSSYDSMNKWSMDTSSLIRLHREFDKERLQKKEAYFFNGNYFNFFTKYSESGIIYKKNHYFSSLFHHDDQLKERLLRSQCCCGYWHGVFGGVYLPYMRDSINLGNIYAENRLPDGSSCINKNMIILKNNDLSATIHLKGGCISSINSFDKKINLLNSFTRRPEFYHKDIREPVYYDLDDRYSFSEYIISGRPDVNAYLKNRYGVQGNYKDCIFSICDTQEEDALSMKANKKCLLNDEIIEIGLKKVFRISNNQFHATYELSKDKVLPNEENYLMIDVNLHNVFEHKEDIKAEKFKKITLKSKHHGDVRLSFSDKIEVLIVPIRTFSIYHQKPEEILQSNTLVLLVPLDKKNFRITLELL